MQENNEKQSNTKTITVCLPVDVYEKLNKEAEIDRRSLSNMVSVIIDKYFSDNK